MEIIFTLKRESNVAFVNIIDKLYHGIVWLGCHLIMYGIIQRSEQINVLISEISNSSTMLYIEGRKVVHSLEQQASNLMVIPYFANWLD